MGKATQREGQVGIIKQEKKWVGRGVEKGFTSYEKVKGTSQFAERKKETSKTPVRRTERRGHIKNWRVKWGGDGKSIRPGSPRGNI